MANKTIVAALCAYIAAVSCSVNAATALAGRDLDGNPATFEAYYSADLDITWLADTSLAASNTFGVVGINPTTGIMTWNTANSWIAAMNADGGTGYLGINTWRLPNVDVNSDNTLVYCNGNNDAACVDNEMGYLYWEQLIWNGAPDPFSNINTPFTYWSGTTYESFPAQAWIFNFNNGTQSPILKDDGFSPSYAWAVFDGDIAAVPVPTAVWLFGSGLICLIGIARRKKS